MIDVFEILNISGISESQRPWNSGRSPSDISRDELRSKFWTWFSQLGVPDKSMGERSSKLLDGQVLTKLNRENPVIYSGDLNIVHTGSWRVSTTVND
jgi:hypothetical protein